MTIEYTPEQLAEMSGEQNYAGNRALDLNEINLNGDGDAKEIAGKLTRVGGYFRKRILIGKPKDEKPEEINLGKSVSLIFLKIRRRLVQRGQDGQIVRSTSEHNHKGDVVSLYTEGSRTPEVGIASDLRERHEGLRTVQIVYALHCDGPNEPELVKLVVKGASLGSEAKADTTTDFYSYVSSFGKNAQGQKEHFYQFKTVLSAVLEEGKKSYFAMDFKRGEILSAEEYVHAINKMAEVSEKCKEIDAARAAKIVKGATVSNDAVADEPIEFPKDDINPDDIPF